MTTTREGDVIPFGDVESAAQACWAEFAGIKSPSWVSLSVDERDAWLRVGAHVARVIDDAYNEGAGW